MKTFEKYLNEENPKVKKILQDIIDKFGKLQKEFENPNMKKDAESLVKIAKKLMNKVG